MIRNFILINRSGSVDQRDSSQSTFPPLWEKQNWQKHLAEPGTRAGRLGSMSALDVEAGGEAMCESDVGWSSA